MINPKLNLNNAYNDLPHKSLVNALNVEFDKNFTYLVNETGNVLKHTYAHPICGIITTPKWDIVFTTNDAKISSIYKVNDAYSILILTGDFGFKTTNTITGCYTYNSHNELIVAWTDNVSNVRIINIDVLGFPVGQGNSLSLDNIDLISLYPNFKQPTFGIDSIVTGGSIAKGTYQFVIAYYISKYDVLNWCIPSPTLNAFQASDLQYEYLGTARGLSNGTPSSLETNVLSFTDRLQTSDNNILNQRFNIRISNLDTRYSKFKFAVIYRTDTITKVYDVQDVPITSESVLVSYSGNYDIELSLNDVTIPFAAIDKAGAITNINDQLVLSNIVTPAPLNYQKYANNIKVRYSVKHIDEEYNSLTSFSFKGLVPDEIYALYIGLVRNNGNFDKFYHIPGRAAMSASTLYDVVYEQGHTDTTPGEKDIVSSISRIGSFIDKGFDGYKNNKLFQIFNTSGRIASSTLATASISVISYDLNSSAATPAEMQLKITYDTNIVTTPSNLTINIDRSSVPSELYGLTGTDDVSPIITFNIQNKLDPNTLAGLLLPPFITIPTLLAGLSPLGYIALVIGVINTAATGFTAELVSYDDEHSGIIKIKAPAEYGDYGKNIVVRTTVTNRYWTDPVFNTKWGTEVVVDTLSEFADSTPVGSSGTSTGDTINLTIGSTSIFDYVIPANITIEALMKVLVNKVNTLSEHTARFVDTTLTLIGNINLGDAINDPEDDGTYLVTLSSLNGQIGFSAATKFQGAIIASEQNKILSYWENESETYPDTSDFDIYNVLEDGTNDKLSTSLRNAKVRHHRMPDLYNLYSAVNGTTLDKVIALDFLDIKFPKIILSEIQGFYIGYATRDNNNVTVLGYAPVLRDNIYGITGKGNDYIRFSDFSLMNLKPNINNAYLKTIVNNSQPLKKERCVYDSPTYNITVPNIYPVKEANYLPKDNSATVPSNLGREETLMLQLTRLYNDKYILAPDVSGNALVTTSQQALEFATLNTINPDMYMPFYKQKVAIVGNMVSIDKTKYAYTVEDLTGFDCYISNHCELQYRGNQSLDTETIDGESVYTRFNGDEDNNATTIFNVYKFPSYSTINYLARQLDNITTYKLQYSRKNWLMQLKEGLSYKTNFNIIPSEDDTISYSNYYNYINNIKSVIIADPNITNYQAYPNRLYRSHVQNKEQLAIGWRYIDILSYYEIGKNREYIINVAGIDNLLIIHTLYSIFLAKLKDKISYNGDEIYLGQADIFDRVPQELQTSGDSNLGLQSNLSAVVNNLGYCFYNPYNKCIFVYSNQGIKQFNDSSCNDYIQTNFNVNTEVKSFYNDIVLFGYDNRKKKLLITNKDSVNPITLSFVETLTSKHSYVPSYMYENARGLYMLNDNGTQIYKVEGNNYGNYFGQQYSSYVDVLLRDTQELKQLHGLSFISSYTNAQSVDSIIVYTENQISKEYMLLEFTSITDWDKIRYSNGRWFYNNIRDYSSDSIVQSIIENCDVNLDSIIEDKVWYDLSMFENNYFIVRINCNNGHSIVFKDIDFEYIKL